MFWHPIFHSWKQMMEEKKLFDGSREMVQGSHVKNWKQARTHLPSPSPLNFVTPPQDLWQSGDYMPSHCEELHLQRHSEQDSWIFIRWLAALIYQSATKENDGSWGVESHIREVWLREMQCRPDMPNNGPSIYTRLWYNIGVIGAGCRKSHGMYCNFNEVCKYTP